MVEVTQERLRSVLGKDRHKRFLKPAGTVINKQIADFYGVDIDFFPSNSKSSRVPVIESQFEKDRLHDIEIAHIVASRSKFAPLVGESAADFVDPATGLGKVDPGFTRPNFNKGRASGPDEQIAPGIVRRRFEGSDTPFFTNLNVAGKPLPGSQPPPKTASQNRQKRISDIQNRLDEINSLESRFRSDTTAAFAEMERNWKTRHEGKGFTKSQKSQAFKDGLIRRGLDKSPITDLRKSEAAALIKELAGLRKEDFKDDKPVLTEPATRALNKERLALENENQTLRTDLKGFIEKRKLNPDVLVGEDENIPANDLIDEYFSRITLNNNRIKVITEKINSTSGAANDPTGGLSAAGKAFLEKLKRTR